MVLLPRYIVGGCPGLGPRVLTRCQQNGARGKRPKRLVLGVPTSIMRAAVNRALCRRGWVQSQLQNSVTGRHAPRCFLPRDMSACEEAYARISGHRRVDPWLLDLPPLWPISPEAEAARTAMRSSVRNRLYRRPRLSLHCGDNRAGTSSS